MPGTLIATTLGLPVSAVEQNVNAHFVNPPRPVDLRSSTVPPSKPRSSSDGACTNSRSPRSPSVNQNGTRANSKGSRGNSVDKLYLQHRQSKSPSRVNQQEQRGRSSERS